MSYEEDQMGLKCYTCKRYYNGGCPYRIKPIDDCRFYTPIGEKDGAD